MKLERDKYLVEDEFKRLIYAARTRPHVNSERDYAMLATTGLCGLRDVELIGVRHADLARLNEKPSVVRVRTAKRRKVQYDDVAVPPTAVNAIVVYLKTLGPADRRPFDRVFPVSTRQAGRIFKQYAKIAGLNPKYSIHALRHYRGVSLYMAHHDIVLVKEALRHASLASTQIYVHTVDQIEKASAVDVDMDGYDGKAEKRGSS